MDSVGQLTVVLLDPAGRPAAKPDRMEISRKTLLEVEESLPEDQHALGAVFSISKARIKSEGLYTFVLVYNGQDIASLPIPIYRQHNGR